MEILARHQVAFIVVGGVAGVLAGAPISTFDLDIVHAREPENLVRLHAALVDLDARYRDQTGRDLRPELATLGGDGHHLLITRCGPIDLLGRIGLGRGYDELLGDSAARAIGELTVQVLGLAALIRAKEEAGRDKDRAMLPILRRTLAESERS